MESREAPHNKKDFYPRWRALEFGNRLRMWDDRESLMASGYGGTVTARSKGHGGGATYYGVPAQDACSDGQYAAMTFNESAPDDRLLMQGELMHGGMGYSLFSSTLKAPMREAMKSGVQHYGLQALGRVKYFANAKSYDMLMELLDLYADAVIEFGCYSRHLGEIPGHNTVIWEVRKY